MRQVEFEQRNEDRWRRFEQALARIEGSGAEGFVARRIPPDLSDLPDQYGEICRDLSLARARGYSPRLLERLNALALSGHSIMYTHQNDLVGGAIRYLAHDFPRAVRRDAGPVGLASAAFVAPALAIFVAILLQPDLVYSLFAWEQVSHFEAMYDPSAAHIGADRGASSDVAMFGFYVWNNIGVAFRCFAMGLFAGIGSIAMLVYNGLVLGGVAAHLINIDFQSTFFPFVIGHGSFELVAIVFSGAAGMRIGLSLIAPGTRKRLDALRVAAAESMGIVYGVIVMLVIAAALEAFWSAKAGIPAEAKLFTGALLWAFVWIYFTFVARGRSRSGPERDDRGS